MEKKVRSCRVCGCTDDNCSQCIEKTGMPCLWLENDLCSACVDPVISKDSKKWNEFIEDLKNDGVKVMII